MAPSAASGFRFSPPALAISPAVQWTLVRGLGPVDSPAPTVDPEAAWEEAARLGLAPRIGARIAAARLVGELDEDAARRFVAARRVTAATAVRYEQLAADLAELAAERGISLLFLKGMALQLGGYSRPGARPFGDLDCLAREPEARDLFRLLVERGFVPAEAPANEQHLPPLAAPGWGAVDLHFALRGVWHPSGEWWVAERLLAEGRSRSLSALSGASIPDRDVLAAHALVHGIDQHGLAPGRHGLLRMVGDLADLLPEETDSGSFLSAAQAWIAPSVSQEETVAALALTRRLIAGDVPSGPALDEPPGRLLRHLLAAALDESYQGSSRWRNLRVRLRRAAERGDLLRYIRRKLRRRR